MIEDPSQCWITGRSMDKLYLQAHGGVRPCTESFAVGTTRDPAEILYFTAELIDHGDVTAEKGNNWIAVESSRCQVIDLGVRLPVGGP